MTDPLGDAGAMAQAQVQAIVQNAAALGLTWQRKLATVVDGTNAAAVTAILDGDTQAIAMVSTIGALLPDTRVYVDVIPPSGLFIMGSVGGNSPQYLSQQLLTGDQSFVTFDDIPSTLTRIAIYWRAAMTGAGATSHRMDINADSSVSYSTINLAGTGAGVATEQLASTAFYMGVGGGPTLSGAGHGTIWINDWNQYRIPGGSALHMSQVSGSNNTANNYTRLGYGNYANALTTPRTKIRFFMDGASILAGSFYRVEGHI